MEEDLASQIPEVRRACEAYRIPVLEMPGYEADDVIGTLSRQAREAGFDVVIVTADKDMLQLVEGSRVRVFHTGKEKFLDETGVAEFFGVAPSQVVDVLALMGDASDNIPGVPRVGEVTAKKWITEFGSLDRLLERAEEVKGKVGESLREHKEDALLSRRLAAIRTDLPIPFDPEVLKRSAPDPQKLKDLFVELEFHSLAAEIQGEEAQAKLSAIRLSEDEPFDLARAGDWPGIALLTRDGHTLLAVGGGSEVFIAEGQAARIAERWAALDRPGARLAIPDAKPLDRLLEEAGRAVRGDLFDVGLAQYVLSPGVGSSDFEPLVFQRLGRRVTPDKEAGVVNGALPAQQAIESADRWLAERASGAAELAPVLSAELAARPALEKVYREIERPLTPVLARMERAGIAIDPAFLNEMSARMETDLRALERQIWEEAGEEFNINSPAQLGTILFEKLGLQGGKKTAKTKALSTGVEVLNELAAQGLSLPRRVLEYREIAKLKGTYVDALPALADEASRVHTSFRQTVAATGRLSSSDPNLQNIPIRTAAGREIRRAFVAPPGRALVVADYSQIELRILAHISGDAALIQAFCGRLGHPPHHGGEGLRRRAGSGLERNANRGQAHQLRPPVRNGGLLARQGPRRLERGGEGVHRRLLRPVPGSAGLPRPHPGRGAREEGGHDALWPRAADPRDRVLECRRARERRAHGLERSLPGHGSRHHQDRHDPPRRRPAEGGARDADRSAGARRARARGTRRGGRRGEPPRSGGHGRGGAAQGPTRRGRRLRTELARGEVTGEAQSAIAGHPEAPQRRGIPFLATLRLQRDPSLRSG